MKNRRTVEGEELTPEFLEELAAEAEAGYEGFAVKHVKLGRPSIAKGGASKRLQVRVDPEVESTLRQIAEDRDVTVSEIAREALERYVADAA